MATAGNSIQNLKTPIVESGSQGNSGTFSESDDDSVNNTAKNRAVNTYNRILAWCCGDDEENDEDDYAAQSDDDERNSDPDAAEEFDELNDCEKACTPCCEKGYSGRGALLQIRTDSALSDYGSNCLKACVRPRSCFFNCSPIVQVVATIAAGVAAIIPCCKPKRPSI